MSFKIKPINELPEKKQRKRLKIYDDILTNLENQPRGYYLVTVPDKKNMSVFVALSKRLKGRKGKEGTVFKLHFRSGNLYVEKCT
jgi:hypothetical protein